jgi:hypothetical protein
VSTDPMAYVLSCLRRAADNAYPWSLTPTEAGALVAEVARLRGERDHYRRAMEYADAEAERLREDNHDLRLMAEEAAHAENLNAQDLRDARRDKAQIIAWLREPGEYVDPACARLADAIERGAYCREEKP